MSDVISALCVSQPSRYGMLQRAIYNFASQDYEDKELLIALTDKQHADQVSQWLVDDRHEDVDLSAVRVVFTEEESLPKQAVELFKKSVGDYIVPWSDDNLSHSTRLSCQKDKSTECATVVSQSFYYFYDTDELFLTNYCQPGRRFFARCAPSSLMVSRDDFFCVHLQKAETRCHWPSQLLSRLERNFPFQRYKLLQDVEDGFLFMQGVAGDTHQRTTEYHRTAGSMLPLTWTRDQILSEAHKIDRILGGYVFPHKTVDVAGKDAAACVISGENIRCWPSWFEPILPHSSLIAASEE